MIKIEIVQKNVLAYNTRGIMKCPKNMWKMYFSREAICILFWNAPNSNNFIFGSFLVLKLVTCLFFEMPHFSVVKNGAFRKIDTWLVLKREMNRKWNCSNLGHFKIKCIWPHVKNTSFTCFLGQFMILRVIQFLTEKISVWNVFEICFHAKTSFDHFQFYR